MPVGDADDCSGCSGYVPDPLQLAERTCQAVDKDVSDICDLDLSQDQRTADDNAIAISEDYSKVFVYATE